MEFRIEIDEEKAQQKLTFRERQGIRILIIIFTIIYPAKYSHQLKDIFSEIFKD